MSIIDDLMKTQLGNLQGMLPKKDIEDYRLVYGGVNAFNGEAQRLIMEGYEPVGFLQTHQLDSYIYFVREFVKYKKP